MLSTALRRTVRVATATCGSGTVPTGTPRAFGRHGRCWASTLVLSDPSVGSGDNVITSPPSTQAAVQAAQTLHPDHDVVLLAVGGDAAPTRVPSGVTKILWAPTDTPSNPVVPETVAAAVQQAVQHHTDGDCQAVVGTSSKFGATIIPRVAALLQVSPVTDIVQILAKGQSTVTNNRNPSLPRFTRNTHSITHSFSILPSHPNHRYLHSPHVRWKRLGQSPNQRRLPSLINPTH